METPQPFAPLTISRIQRGSYPFEQEWTPDDQSRERNWASEGLGDVVITIKPRLGAGSALKHLGAGVKKLLALRSHILPGRSRISLTAATTNPWAHKEKSPLLRGLMHVSGWCWI